MKHLKIWGIIMVLLGIAIMITSCVLVQKIENASTAETEEVSETTAAPTKTSDTMKAQIKDWEGFTANAIWDNGAYAYGYGHRSESIKAGDTITREEADALFEEDIICFEEAVVNFAESHGITLNQNQFDALVSFVYNLGENYLSVIEERNQTNPEYKLVDYITTGKYTAEEMTEEWTSYCHSGGEEIPGLVARRNYEVNLFLNGEID